MVSKIMRVLLANVLVIALLVAVFDVAAFHLLPDRAALRFPEYRQLMMPDADVAGRGNYPNGYFVRHAERGFDIAKNVQASHWVEGITYPIWSNSLGCFDREHAHYDEYIYFAGDSYTWGYTPFPQKFGALIERATGATIFKCGVTHTGQRHQFDKFVEIVGQTAELPKAIFVFFSSNDVANDFAHPHTSVVDGWLVDTAVVHEDDGLTRRTRQELEQRIEAALAENTGQLGGWLASVKRTLKTYSLSANMVDYTKDYVVDRLSPATDEAASITHIYHLPQDRNARYWYADNRRAQENKNAFLDFSRFATENNIELIVVLIPNERDALDTDYYRELRSFLAANEIRYLDLASEFSARELSADDLYWPIDNHLNIAGNRAVAEILMEEFPDIF